jgi:hypothetical protein
MSVERPVEIADVEGDHLQVADHGGFSWGLADLG